MCNDKNSPVLLYDGECGLCSYAVQFILRFEKDKRLQFATLQSDWAKNFLQNSEDVPAKLDSVILLQNNSIYIKSRAITHVAHYLKFPLNLLVLFKIIPTFIADRMYDWVARNRQRFFKAQCRIISKEQSERFIA